MNKILKSVILGFKEFFLNLAIAFIFLFPVQLLGQTIISPDDGSDLEILAAKEVRRYIYLRTGQLITIQGAASLPASDDLILVANDNNPMVENLRSLLNHTTTTGGIIIKTVSESGRIILVITGNDGAATLHAAYRYAEHLGVFFDLAEDVIPDTEIALDITGYDEAGIPNFETTGIQPFHDFPSGPDLWSTEDYLHFISQLPKMGMNFIGVHTYTRYNTLWDKDGGHNRGPEPSVWIGLEGDFNSSTGDVSWSYPAYYAHSLRPNWIWGFDKWNTGNYHAGAKDLFPTDGWGSDVMGENPPQDGDIAASNEVFNRTGAMFNTAFTHAQNIGVKTALGTELPLGVENDGYDSWVRGIPEELQDRLTGMGKDPTDPNTVKEVYKGIFKRIMATHPLDYYWLWSYEIWPGENSTWVESVEDDITLAIQALNELGKPFQIAHAGWQLGTDNNPAELESVFPSEAPFFSLMGSAIGYDQLSSERVKWPSTWLEYDRSLGQPELAVDRIHEDAYAALGVNAEGFITENWRTRIMGPNIGAMRELSWTYSPTGEPLSKNVPTWPGDFVDNFYVNWATKMFGPEAASEIANIFKTLEYDMPHPVEWAEEQTGTFYLVPGAILANSTSWAAEESSYSFVADFENLRSQIVGEGNLERFDYWLKSWQALKLKGQYGCVRYQFEDAMENSNWTDALNYRRNMASLWEQIMELEVEKATNVSDLGDIMNLEVVNWKQLMMNKHNAALEDGLGYALPSDANPSQTYNGDAFIKVLAPRTHAYDEEALKLKVIAMGVSSPSLKYKALGATSWNTISLTNVGRSVYDVTIPAQTDDFEYYIESGSTVFPVNAPEINATVVVSGNDNFLKYSLTTDINGKGSIKLEPEGYLYDPGTIVTATTIPEIGHLFNSWSGAAQGSEDSVTIIMDGNKLLTANFDSITSAATPQWPNSPPNDYWVSYHIAHPEPSVPGTYANPGDPNGAIYSNGRYHLHYIAVDDALIEDGQVGPAHTWAHLSSPDLVHWEWHPTVLSKLNQGHGMFSGTAFETMDEEIAIIYHGSGPDSNYVSVATNPNLDEWGTPMLINPIDPETGQPVDYWAWWDPDLWILDGKYYALTGWEDPSIMTSTDLQNWTWEGKLFHPNYTGFPDSGIDRATEDVSCANMFLLGDKWMLLCLSHGQQSNAKGCSYYLGDFIDGKYLPEFHGRMNFHNDTENPGVATFHAPESMLTPDGRRVMWAWIQCDASPSGIQSLPREIWLGADGTLRMKPIEELKTLRTNEVSHSDITVTSSTPYEFTEPTGNNVEFTVTFKAPLPDEFGVKFLTDPDDNDGISITAGTNRTDAEIIEIHGNTTDVINPPLSLEPGEDLTIRVYIDNQVVEVFFNKKQGAAVYTDGYLRTEPNISLFTNDADVDVSELKAWNISSPFISGSSDQFTLITNATSGGSVTSGGTYNEGTVVSVIFHHDEGYQFDGWSGDASGTTNPLSVKMDSNKSITANFSVSTVTWIKVDSHDPSVTVTGSGYDSYSDAPFAYMNTWYPIWDGSASFTFSGTKVRFYAVTSQWNGDASLKIDGTTVGTAGTFSSGTVQEEIGEVLVWESGILPNSSHTFEVIAVDEIGVDAFEYSPDATDIVVTDNVISDLIIYPNPANTKLYMAYDKPIENFEIYNSTGYLVKNGKGTRIDVFEFPPGLYIIKMNGSVSAKFFKE